MSSPPLNKSCNRAGLFKRPVRSSASSRWPQALVQNRKQLRGRSFVLAAWPSCRGPRQPAANEPGGGPVRHVRPTELESLAGPSAPCSTTPHAEFDLTPRISQRAEQRWCARRSPCTSLARGKWLRFPDHNWLWLSCVVVNAQAGEPLPVQSGSKADRPPRKVIVGTTVFGPYWKVPGAEGTAGRVVRPGR